jgi:tetraacyldisaccharide 4'-kinase
MLKFLRIFFLLPVSIVYWIITSLRNLFYSIGWLKSQSFKLPVICVGNISTGGTGKSPMVEYLVKLLQSQNVNSAVLSRGYKRKTSGFVLADENTNAAELGDEPAQFHRKFPKITVAVCESRVEGVEKLIELKPSLQSIILDDAFQHRSIKPGFSLMLTEFARPYFSDIILPSGNLRECRLGAKRADVIIVTKSPVHLEEKTKLAYLQKIKPSQTQTVLFSHIVYGELICIFNNTNFKGEKLKNTEVLLFTGISNPQPLKDYFQQSAAGIQLLRFPDHHSFTEADLLMISKKFRNIAQENKIIVCTEKDYVRLINSPVLSVFSDLPVFYQSMESRFSTEDQSKFEKIIIDYVRKN